ncbi:3,4-dihydroxy-2-butanone-4-phosphate synthase [Micrococcoides hystricis]|uniref:Multifunctional fusion protein n=1 Tax=Micrococcoides hystricis TaxID=1572761 RepID=A0ABV6P820_9MICC
MTNTLQPFSYTSKTGSDDFRAYDRDGADTPLELDPIEDALEALAAGKPVVVVDDESRENEGDIIFAAEKATPELMGFTIRYTSGVICAPITAARADVLGLPPMVRNNQDAKGTAYTLSCDAAAGITTGISGADRTVAVKLLADEQASAADLVRPGHIFPLRAVDGGVLARRGHTEAAVDLCRLAGLTPAGVIAELNHDDGTMMRLPALRAFADAFSLPLVSIEDLVQYIEQCEDATRLVDAGEDDLTADTVATAGGSGQPEIPPAIQLVPSPVVPIPTPFGTLSGQAFAEAGTGIEHFVLSAPSPAGATLLVRLHSECLTGDIFGSQRCDCGEQLTAALAQIAAEGGLLVYLRGHEGRGIGLAQKMHAYALQDEGVDTVDANVHLGLPVDARDYTAAAQILRQYGLDSVRLLTNNPTKVEALQSAGIAVAEQVPTAIAARASNEAYLRTKVARMGHTISEDLLKHSN